MAYDWILGIGLMFGLALAFAMMVQKEFAIGLVVFLFMFAGFLVWAAILPAWIMIMMLMFVVILVYLKIKMGVGI